MMQEEIVVDMDESLDDYIEEDQVEIVLDPEHILDPGPCPPLIVRFPPPHDFNNPTTQDEHLRTCMTCFTGERPAGRAERMCKPNRAPQNLRVPYYTRDMDQALLYAQRLFESLLTCTAFAKLEWDPRTTRLRCIRGMAGLVPMQFQAPINGLIVTYSKHWHRSDLAMALAIIFKQPMDTVMRRIDAVLAHVAANPPSAAIMAEPVKKTRRGRPLKKEAKDAHVIEGGEEMIVID